MEADFNQMNKLFFGHRMIKKSEENKRNLSTLMFPSIFSSITVRTCAHLFNRIPDLEAMCSNDACISLILLLRDAAL